MKQPKKACSSLLSILFGATLIGFLLSAPVSAEESRGKTSYAPVDIQEDFAKIMARPHQRIGTLVLGAISAIARH